MRSIAMFCATVFFCACCTFLQQSVRAQPAQPCGTDLASHRGEWARSNGSSQGTGNECGAYWANDAQGFGYEWQCVEYVRRFYSRQFGITLPRRNAADYDQALAQVGFRRFANNTATELPEIDDIIVFGRRVSGTDPFGHIAVVTGRDASGIQIIEQNWSSTGIASLPYSTAGGAISVGNRQGRTGYYPVLAWFRRPSTTPTPIPVTYSFAGRVAGVSEQAVWTSLGVTTRVGSTVLGRLTYNAAAPRTRSIVSTSDPVFAQSFYQGALISLEASVDGAGSFRLTDAANSGVSADRFRGAVDPILDQLSIGGIGTLGSINAVASVSVSINSANRFVPLDPPLPTSLPPLSAGYRHQLRVALPYISSPSGMSVSILLNLDTFTRQ
jgi:hypothetical protein